MLGRRERKKLQTRRALAEAALRLFLERGYDAVTVADIADEADTAVTTLFKHFPEGKESLVFEGGAELELGEAAEDRGAALAAAIRDRADGERVLDALEAFIGSRGPFARGRSARFRHQLELIASTPALRAYARRKWIECEDVVVAAMAEATGTSPDDVALRAAARYVLETPNIVGSTDGARDALHTVFDRLRAGWPEL
jgi:AcrR family transcriptional regulator